MYWILIVFTFTDQSLFNNLTDKKYFDVATNPRKQNRFAVLSLKEWIA